MRIARVFPTKTSLTPTDQDAYFGLPPMFPKYDRVYISCTFTWDKHKAMWLKNQWEMVCNDVRIGGPAFDDHGDTFTPGMFLKPGVVILTRGCVFSCSFCLAHKREGKFREIGIQPGNIIQDNNVMASSDRYWSKIVAMLRSQKSICFKGGIDKRLLTAERLEDIRSLRIKELWFACDSDRDIELIRKTGLMLQRAGFKRYHLYCYVLVGNNAKENTNRLREVYKSGFYPFAQLYRDQHDSTSYSNAWKDYQRRWSRPAAIISRNRWLEKHCYFNQVEDTNAQPA